MLLEWDLCLPATLPGPHNDPAKPSGSWCSRTRWHGIDFVTVARDWLAGVKRAEVETAVALPGSGSFDRAMHIVEVVISPSKAGHECSRNADASRATLRRPEVREQIEFFWSQAPPIPSELSVDEHAGLLAKAPGRLGNVRLLGCKLRHRRTGWTRRLGRRSALMLWQEEHNKKRSCRQSRSWRC